MGLTVTGVTMEDKLYKQISFIPARFQLPFLNISKIYLDNLAFYTDGDIFRNYFCQ
jgi:hypothetical protein